MKITLGVFALLLSFGFTALPVFAMESVTTITTVTTPQLLTLADFERTYAGTKSNAQHRWAKEKYAEYRAATPDSTTLRTVQHSSSATAWEASPVMKSTTVTTHQGSEKSTVTTTSVVPAPVVKTTVTSTTTRQF